MAAGDIIVQFLAETGSFETDTKRAQDQLVKFEKAVKMMQKTMSEGYQASENFVGPLQPSKLRPAIDGVENLTRAVQKSQAGFRASNQVMQQASYQVTDFVVQVSGGVDVARAFGQQAPQFLAAFGGIGAAIGAVVAVGAAFVPMMFEALKSTKTLADSQKNLDDALSQVTQTAQSFDMKNMIEQFNAADSNVRRGIINLIEYRRTATQIAAEESNRALQTQLRGLTDPGFLQRAMGNFEGVDLGLPNASIAKDLFAEIRSGTTEAQILAQKYSSELMKGNDEARKLAATLNKVALDQQSAANAASAQSKFLQQAKAAGETGIIPTGKDKTTQSSIKESKTEMEQYADSIAKANEQFLLLGDKRHLLDSLKDSIDPEVWEKLSRDLDNMAANYGKLTVKMSEETKIAQQIAQNFAQQFSDTLVNGLMKGKMAFDDFANSIIAMIMKIMINRAVLMFLDAFLPGGLGGNSATTSVPGKADGGYTGDGGKYEPAGIVHKGEFVMTKEATNRIGVGNLYRMMRGHANGGLVGSSPLAMAGVGGGNVNINITNEAGGDGYQATATARKNDTGFDVDILVRKALTNDLRNNGPMSQTLSATYGLRRSTR